MSINIKNREAERLLAEIKQATGKGTSAIVLDLLRAEKERLERKRELTREEKWARVREIQEAIKRETPPDAPSYEEIMDEMYDEYGLPR
ncbi:type II toxin-antitoxin system VapB family antitoxin [Terrarubrum flagellatum]|uniref:type II toxin-antitoxin system VapB family antitoxin n=1 Tax=Terrirubrum flagellatum TaxID=2895980 RepID=UPI0031453E2C